ncbi:YbjN domain-containing protein [Corynebacterium mendelii]|uniref:YbjN domain-containing protein n=1 Tax=Corynebacterium mendelii TaxID=2765362 RepID=A0A939IXD9_9CORY|nr:YbjN domain-containing protein [Corynebacterium mendelii]MBN9643958.1 YbjN domain-containing protein [Corynebacterium mendelii]
MTDPINDQSTTVTPLSWPRMMALVTAFGFEGNDTEDNRFYAFVNGAPLRFDGTTAPDALLVNTTLFDYQLPVDRCDEVLAFVNGFNATTYYVHAAAVTDHADGTVTAVADCPIFAPAGLDDLQLQEMMERAITGCVEFAGRYCTHFGFTDPTAAARAAQSKE